MTQWTDHEAAHLARLGDQRAFRLLVERHSHAIFRVAFRMTRHEQDAEDIVQETFLRAYKQIRSFDARSAFSTWLYRISVNVTLDLMRHRKRAAGADFDDVATEAPSPERLCRSHEFNRLLEPALLELTPTERMAFILRHYENCPIDDIAKVLNVQPGAAKHSIFRAVQKLRRALQPLWEVQPK